MFSVRSSTSSPLKTGKIVAVCISNKPNVPKYPQEHVEMGAFGLIGDIHAGNTRISRRSGQLKFNDRQISVVAQEDLDFLNGELGIALKPGDLAENITTRGLGSLSRVASGMCLTIGKSIILEVTQQNNPCKNLHRYHRLLVSVSYRTRTRGVLAIVRDGVGSTIRPDDAVSLYARI